MAAGIQTITNGSETLTYTYDDRGFITQVQLDTNNLSQYRYDAWGELVRENYKWGSDSYTMIYAYDVGGNMISKTKYEYIAGDTTPTTQISVVNYTYDTTWKDKLASYNGVSISYDNIGNPLSDGTWNYTWTQGRMLQQMSNASNTLTFKYNDSGIRTEKTVNGVTTKYNVVGGAVTWEQTGSATPIYYLYDADGSLWGMNYNGTTYFYVRNAQGDIIRIVDANGNSQAEYRYDAWGMISSATGPLAYINPYRYRGYRQDNETGLYYLQSRYYNSYWGRFINADSIVGESGKLFAHNLFAYCANNPINFADPIGLKFIITNNPFSKEEKEAQAKWKEDKVKIDKINRIMNGLNSETQKKIWDVLFDFGFDNVDCESDNIVFIKKDSCTLTIVAPGYVTKVINYIEDESDKYGNITTWLTIADFVLAPTIIGTGASTAFQLAFGLRSDKYNELRKHLERAYDDSSGAAWIDTDRLYIPYTYFD